MTETLGIRIGRTLRERRIALGISQQQLAERAGLSAKHLGRLERGEADRASIATLAALATALGCPLCLLVDEPPTTAQASGAARARLDALVMRLSNPHVDALAKTAELFLSMPR